MNDYLALLLGLAAAALGGEFFVRGAVGLADWARVPAGIIGATVAAFATSSPELAVAVGSTVKGAPQIAFGDALGANVVNVGLILGLILVMRPLKVSRGPAQRDFPWAMTVPLGTMLLIVDGHLSRIDAGLLLAGFLTWLGLTIAEARRERSAAEEVLGEQRSGRAVAFALLGLGFLVLAGEFIVTGAKGMGASWGWDPFTVGVTLVAIGTTVPELATALVSRLRGHDEIGLGTILGSNLFNGLFIVAVTGLISPFDISPRLVVPSLVFGALTVVAALPRRGGLLPRVRGGILLALYLASLIVALNPGW